MAKVLIIEDDESLRDMYRRGFELEDFEVEAASDGQEGIEKMVSFKPEVVLLDLMMPKMSGFDVLKRVKDDPAVKNIPIIVLTNINPDSQDLLKNWGVRFIMLKSDNTLSQIVEKVRMVLTDSQNFIK